MSTSSAATFEAHRSHLFGLAYRMLGSAADAEDVLQEAFLRWQTEDRSGVDAPRAFLTTIVTRLCLDVLTSARRRREAYVGPWLPEPVATGDGARLEPVDVASLSLAFLVVLETLSPLERAAFLMREVFDYDVHEVARILDRDEAAVRKLVQRARAHVSERRPRFAPSREAHARLLGEFVQAIVAGDVHGVEALLADEVRATADGGGHVSTARKTVLGREAVARYLVGVGRKGALGMQGELADVNGAPAIVFRANGTVVCVLELETDGARVFAVHLVLNPEKLGHL